MKKLWLWSIIGIVLVVGIFFLVKGNEPSVNYDAFAKCLTEKNAKMYGAYWCPHCIEQKKEFGKSWQYVSYIECSLPNNGGQTQVCQLEGIKGYPTWDFNGTKVEGKLSFEELSSRSGCLLS